MSRGLVRRCDFVTGLGSPLVLPRCRSSTAAEGCDSTDSAEQDTKQLVPRLEVEEEMRLRGETKVGDSGVADVWRVGSSQRGWRLKEERI